MINSGSCNLEQKKTRTVTLPLKSMSLKTIAIMSLNRKPLMRRRAPMKPNMMPLLSSKTKSRVVKTRPMKEQIKTKEQIRTKEQSRTKEQIRSK